MKVTVSLDRKKIGERLKTAIKNTGYTQKEFSELAGIGLSTLKKYISGETFYSIDLLHTFSQLTECTYEYLLCQSDVPFQEYTDVDKDQYLSNAARNALRYFTEGAQKGRSEERIYMYALDRLLINCDVLWYIADYLQIPADINYDMVPQGLEDLYKGKLGDLPISIHDLPELYLLRIRQALIALREHDNQTNKRDKTKINQDFIPYTQKIRGRIKAWLEHIKDIP